MVASLLLGLVCSPTATAHAEEKGAEAGKALLDEAIRHFDDAEFPASQRRLVEARSVTRDPSLLASIHLYLGLHAIIAGNLRQAEQSFQAALSFDGALDLDPRRFKPEFVEAFRRARGRASGELSVTADDASAIVVVDGKPRGRVPFRERLSVGEHLVELRSASGELISSKRIVLRAGERSQISIVVPRRRASGAAELAAPPAPPIEARRRVWSWVAAGATAVSLGIAVGFSAAALSDHRSGCALVDPAGARDCTLDDTQTLSFADEDRYDELRSSLQRNRIVANVAWGMTGALAVTSAVLFWLEGRSSSKERADPTASRSKTGRLRLAAPAGSELGIGVSVSY